MYEHYYQTYNIDGFELQKVTDEVRRLDSELLNTEETTRLVILSAKYGKEITEQYGTPASPKWASGAFETDVFMSFHNGGEDGHTSVGPRGAGVPRNSLVIAKAVNSAAGKEIYNPLMRAVSFYAAQAHDSHQLCGRALLPEGKGDGRGDERMSAVEARDRYLAANGDLAVADLIYAGIMATAFNPDTGKQNVSYEPADHELGSNHSSNLLVQELVAAADLLSSNGPRGPLGALEYSVEQLCFEQKGRLTQTRLGSLGIATSTLSDIESMLGQIDTDPVLKAAFTETLAGQVKFFADFLEYSDVTIKSACGKGIDDMFPGRPQNTDILKHFHHSLQEGQSVTMIWQQAKELSDKKLRVV